MAVTINFFFIFIITVLVIDYLLGVILDILEIRNLSPGLPGEFRGVYDEERYSLSLRYISEKARFSIAESSISIAVILLFIIFGGFNYVDTIAREFGYGAIITGLIFAALLAIFSLILSMPFAIYRTFVIEERYGFNRTTPFTFITDIIKDLFLTAAIGGAVLAAVIWFFERAGDYGWLYAWAAVLLFSLFTQYIAPAVILPLFNKYTPLPDGSLKERVLEYADSQGFKLKGIYTMDGSRRSSKANAFFTGFGSLKRIVLYDTLMEKLNDDEIMAVLAHEMGHYKLGHILKNTVLSSVISFAVFYLLSVFMNNRSLFDAFGMEELSVYASLIFFAFLFSPVNFILSIMSNYMSRIHEYAADAYTVKTTGLAEPMVSALKKLSESNMSNLTPHPLEVFLSYSHPPVLERIKAIRGITAE